MTGTEAFAILTNARELLRQQAAVLGGPQVDLDRAEALGAEISSLLAGVPPAGQLQGVDGALRVRLLECATETSNELAASVIALAHHRRARLAGQVRAERDGAALRQYLPADGQQSSRYLDERR